MGARSSSHKGGRRDSEQPAPPEETPAQRSVTRVLQGELQQVVIAFLDKPRNLCIVSEVCKSFRHQATHSVAWREICRRRWGDKVVVCRLTQAREQELQRRCDEEGCTWRQHYMDAEMDSKRTVMTTEELCQTNWIFSDRCQQPIFSPTGALAMEYFPEGSLRWHFNADHSLQVNGFPPHKFSRRPDWGWVIANCYVRFISTDSRVVTMPQVMMLLQGYENVPLPVFGLGTGGGGGGGGWGGSSESSLSDQSEGGGGFLARATATGMAWAGRAAARASEAATWGEVLRAHT